jgi:hypothetical protein
MKADVEKNNMNEFSLGTVIPDFSFVILYIKLRLINIKTAAIKANTLK